MQVNLLLPSLIRIFVKMIAPNDIFGIADDADFARAALETFRRQAVACAPYREYLALAGIRPE